VSRPRTGFAFLDAGLDQPGSVLAMAHRGGGFQPEIEGLENTLAAFQHAVDLGLRYLETDVRATRDGLLLAFHDEVLDRATERKGPVADLEYAELADVLVGGREEIPLLASLFARFPHACFNIDLKSDAAVAPLAELIASTGAHDRVCVGSFSHRRMHRFRCLLARPVATVATPVEVVALRFLPDRARAALRAVLPAALLADDSAVLQVPDRHRNVRVVDEELVARAHRAGKPVHVWTVNDPAQMHRLLDLGVDGLISDRTDLLRAVLLERGQWLEPGR
jgi:glycerophosphoryl diester phosphodiesterase